MNIFEDYSLEITTQGTQGLADAAAGIPAGTLVNVTFLAHEVFSARAEAARRVKELGFRPVPHINAKNIASETELEQFLTTLQEDGTSGQVLVIAGDLTKSDGPYEDSFDLIRSTDFKRYGITDVAIAGYPDGHAAIDDDTLWQAMEAKVSAIKDQGLNGSIITQFGFQAELVFPWIEEVRRRGINLPIRLGLVGPAPVSQLMKFTSQFHIPFTEEIAKAYGTSLERIEEVAAPDRLIRALQDGLSEDRHGVVKLHFYNFGGVPATVEWINSFASQR